MKDTSKKTIPKLGDSEFSLPYKLSKKEVSNLLGFEKVSDKHRELYKRLNWEIDESEEQARKRLLDDIERGKVDISEYEYKRLIGLNRLRKGFNYCIEKAVVSDDADYFIFTIEFSKKIMGGDVFKHSIFHRLAVSELLEILDVTLSRVKIRDGKWKDKKFKYNLNHVMCWGGERKMSKQHHIHGLIEIPKDYEEEEFKKIIRNTLEVEVNKKLKRRGSKPNQLKNGMGLLERRMNYKYNPITSWKLQEEFGKGDRVNVSDPEFAGYVVGVGESTRLITKKLKNINPSIEKELLIEKTNLERLATKDRSKLKEFDYVSFKKNIKKYLMNDGSDINEVRIMNFQEAKEKVFDKYKKKRMMVMEELQPNYIWVREINYNYKKEKEITLGNTWLVEGEDFSIWFDKMDKKQLGGYLNYINRYEGNSFGGNVKKWWREINSFGNTSKKEDVRMGSTDGDKIIFDRGLFNVKFDSIDGG